MLCTLYSSVAIDNIYIETTPIYRLLTTLCAIYRIDVIANLFIYCGCSHAAKPCSVFVRRTFIGAKYNRLLYTRTRPPPSSIHFVVYDIRNASETMPYEYSLIYRLILEFHIEHICNWMQCDAWRVCARAHHGKNICLFFFFNFSNWMCSHDRQTSS